MGCWFLDPSQVDNRKTCALDWQKWKGHLWLWPKQCLGGELRCLQASDRGSRGEDRKCIRPTFELQAMRRRPMNYFIFLNWLSYPLRLSWRYVGTKACWWPWWWWRRWWIGGGGEDKSEMQKTGSMFDVDDGDYKYDDSDEYWWQTWNLSRPAVV